MLEVQFNMISTLTGSSDSSITNTDTVSTIKSARILCENVYNIAYGQIVYIGVTNGRAVVNVKCNPSEVVRYGNLKELNCDRNYYADIGAQIGQADDYVEFEYCTLWRGNSNYPVRINNTTYYKQDPTDILEGRYTLRRDGEQIKGYVLKRDRLTSFTESQEKVFGQNIYDKFKEARSKQAKSTSKSAAVLKKIRAKNKSITTNYTDEQDGLG